MMPHFFLVSVPTRPISRIYGLLDNSSPGCALGGGSEAPKLNYAFGEVYNVFPTQKCK